VQSLTAAFDGSFPLFDQCLRVTASIGVASAPEHGNSLDELMRNADIALYAAKAAGRDQTVFFSGEMAEEVQRRRSIELELRAAIGSDQLSLHYQPIVSCRDNQVTGVEALLRWEHPTNGPVSPAVFIPIAEHAGLMPELGAWVLDRAFQDARRWPDLDVAVNLSPAQFRHVDLDTSLRALVNKHGINPGRIVLEITEGLLLDASPRLTSALDAIRDMGFKLALDDFGTGYSSLNYLHVFQFDKLKIDRSFMRNLSTTNKAKTIVQAVVSLGRNLGMEVIAEGVETNTEAATMQLFNCTAMQGYLFSKAVPADAVAQLSRDIGDSGLGISKDDSEHQSTRLVTSWSA
jgi:predicted signal transduction protein with EAL and GGDEF domain